MSTTIDLRAERDMLMANERTLEGRLREIQAERKDVERKLAQSARNDLRLRPLASVTRTRQERSTSQRIPLERTRDAVCALGRFALSELAAELGCSGARARRELQHPEIAGLVKEVGRLGRTTIYEATDPSRAQTPPAQTPPAVCAPPPERGGGEVVVLRLQTGHAGIKGKLGEDVEVAYVTQEPYDDEAAS